MPRVSVVIPAYNVERYLEECLESVAAQTMGDFEALVIDDGSTDGSAEIARDFARRDARFRLLQRSNGGTGAARNTGADAASGEFLAFVDGDDRLPGDAYERLLDSLEATGSDLATGNVHRFTSTSTFPAPPLQETFERTRPKTHITEFGALLSDRIVPNKLWRRSFWDAHGFRFPEGRLYEDIPVALPAHFLARSVDVIADPVYYHRVRELGGVSTARRRLEPKVLEDRLAAVEDVLAFLSKHGAPEPRRRYERSVLTGDLRHFVNTLDLADDAYRELFLDRVNPLLERLGPAAVDGLAAIERLEWHLVRRRLMPQLLEVIRFRREDLAEAAPVREGRHWYGDYPFRTDAALAIPESVYRLDDELGIAARIDELRWDGDHLKVGGYAYVPGIPADSPGAQTVTVVALGNGRLRRLAARLPRLSGARGKPVHRPDATANAPRPWTDLGWSGFEARIPARRLRGGARNVRVQVTAGAIRRSAVRFRRDGAVPLQAAERVLAGGDLVVAAPGWDGGIQVSRRKRWAMLCGHAVAGDAIELSGRLHAVQPAGLELARRDGSQKTKTYALTVTDGAFTARVPLADLVAPRRRAGAAAPWDVFVAAGGDRIRLLMAGDAPEGRWPSGGVDVRLFRTLDGHAALADEPPRPVITQATWAPDGALELRGDFQAAEGTYEIAFAARGFAERRAFPLRVDAGGRFEARMTPAYVNAVEADLPLQEGRYDLLAGPAGDPGAAVPVLAAPAVVRTPAATRTAGSKTFTLGTSRTARATLLVSSDLDMHERGAYNQRRLRETVYRPGRAKPLRDAVVYTSFSGRQYSDSPRAIHEELVRRGAGLEHLWVVADRACRVAPTATVIRAESAEHHEALATARYVISNDHFPAWFRRRDDQICIQTWHGTPLKRLGFDVSATLRVLRRFQQHWEAQARNWQHVVSPNRFTTPILRRAYRLDGDMIETGYPRNDVLSGADREERSRLLRERLGIPEGVRTVLYAPTFRDNHKNRDLGIYHLGNRLEIDRLRAALGADTVILYRKHHYVADAVPATADGFVRDVSRYPDGTELMLAADVLVTDYSSMMFDFANTRRPMLFYTYDLETYREEIRGFYFDFAGRAPGPLLRTTDEVAEALGDLDAVRSAYEERYARFVETFCELDDGGAAARVVDRVFGD